MTSETCVTVGRKSVVEKCLTRELYQSVIGYLGHRIQLIYVFKKIKREGCCRQLTVIGRVNLPNAQ